MVWSRRQLSEPDGAGIPGVFVGIGGRCGVSILSGPVDFAAPERGSPSEQLYVARCGSCHRAFDPSSMTAAMWQIQVGAMRDKIIKAGQPPLTAQEEHQILDYLERNAGK